MGVPVDSVFYIVKRGRFVRFSLMTGLASDVRVKCLTLMRRRSVCRGLAGRGKHERIVRRA